MQKFAPVYKGGEDSLLAGRVVVRVQTCLSAFSVNQVTQWPNGPPANTPVQEGKTAAPFTLHGQLDVLVDTIQVV